MSACSDDLGIASFLCHWVFHLRSPNTQEYRTQQGRAAKQSFNWCMGTRRRGEAEVRGPGVSIPQFHWPFLSNDPGGFHVSFLLSLLSKTRMKSQRKLLVFQARQSFVHQPHDVDSTPFVP